MQRKETKNDVCGCNYRYVDVRETRVQAEATPGMQVPCDDPFWHVMSLFWALEYTPTRPCSASQLLIGISTRAICATFQCLLTEHSEWHVLWEIKNHSEHDYEPVEGLISSQLLCLLVRSEEIPVFKVCFFFSLCEG